MEESVLVVHCSRRAKGPVETAQWCQMVRGGADQ